MLQNKLLHYRIPFYELLGASVDLTVVHSGDYSALHERFTNKIVPSHKIGPFNLQLYCASEIESSDVVIGMFDLRWLTIMYIFLWCKFRNKKFVWWIGDRGSSKLVFYLKTLICRISDHVIFYNDLAKSHFEKVTGPSSKYKVANNTFDVGVNLSESEVANTDRKSLIFVGSFDYRKRLDLIVTGYGKYREALEGYDLLLLGDGEQHSTVKKLVQELGLEKAIKMPGRVVDPKALEYYYKHSLVSLSYGQAGLSVLQSLGNGVPFITTCNAISGGEISNIRHGQNGYLSDENIDSFFSYIVSIVGDEDLALRLRIGALTHYKENCTMNNMVASFLEVINE